MKKLQKITLLIGSIVMFISGFKAVVAAVEVVIYLRNWYKISETLPNRFPYLMRLISFRELLLYGGIIVGTLSVIAIGNWIMKDDEEPSKLKYSRNYEYYR